MAITGAWDPRMGDLIRESVRHVVRVQTRDKAQVFRDLDVITAAVDYDEQRVPQIQATVTCVLPDDYEYLLQLDPRTHGARVIISAGYGFPGEDDDIHPLADLVIRERNIDRPENTMTLNLQSEESLFIDAAPGTVGVFAVSSGGPVALAQQTIAEKIPNPTFQVLPGAEGYDGGYGLQGSDAYDVVQSALDTIGVQFYNDGVLGRYVFAPAAQIVEPVHHDLRVGAAGTLIDTQVSLTRGSDWANHVVIRFGDVENADPALGQDPREGQARIADGPFACTNGNDKVFFEERRETYVGAAEADQITKSVLLRRITYGRSMVLTAVAAYWLRPRMSVTIQLPTGITEYHLVSAVQFDLAAGTMQLKTRLPEGTPNVTLGA